MIDPYQRIEDILEKIQKRWGEKKLRARILSYKEKLNDQEGQRQGTEQTPSPTTK